jgi:hypothetical protein
MSMTAELVQVTEEELARIRSNPSAVEALFGGGPGFAATLENLPQMTEQMQERARTLGPQMFAKVAANMGPELQKILEARLGVSIASMAAGEGGDVLAKAMEERRAKAVEAKALRGSRKRISLDKNWHGLHFLLCGSAEPDGTVLGQAILGGTDLEEDEGFSGYGPARSLSAEQVRTISEQLSLPATAEQAAGRFDAAKMNPLGIYPGFRANDSAELMKEFERLRDFYAEAAREGKAVVACLV